MLLHIRLILLSSLLVFLYSSAFASEHIVFYAIGEKKVSEFNMLKRYFEKKRFKVSMFNMTNDIEEHLNNINRINSLKANMFIAFNFDFVDNEGCFIAIFTPSVNPGRFNTIEEVPGVHGADSRILAGSIASFFNVRVKELPLFPLIGVDMPGVFVNIQTQKDKINIIFEKLYSGIENYLKKGKQDERQGKAK